MLRLKSTRRFFSELRALRHRAGQRLEIHASRAAETATKAVAEAAPAKLQDNPMRAKKTPRHKAVQTNVYHVKSHDVRRCGRMSDPQQFEALTRCQPDGKGLRLILRIIACITHSCLRTPWSILSVSVRFGFLKGVMCPPVIKKFCDGTSTLGSFGSGSGAVLTSEPLGTQGPPEYKNATSPVV